jgi:hypothetical protein
MDASAVVYVDGPPHDHADRQARDAEKQRAKYPSVFGTGS